MKRALLPALFVLLLLLPLGSAAAQEQSLITLDAPQTVLSGQQFDVAVQISGVENLAGYSLELSFDPGHLQVVSVSPGSVLVGGGYSSEPLAAENIDNAAGLVQYTRLLTHPNDAPFSGSGSLAVVRFEAIGTGITAIEFTVDSTLAPGGVLLGQLGGEDISATTQNVSLTITTGISVTGVSLDQETLLMAVGDTGTLTATVSPANATNKSVSWSSSNEEVATVVSGRVKAVGPGTAVITVRTHDGGHTDTCTVKVGAAITGTVILDGQTQHSGMVVTTEYQDQTYTTTTDSSGSFVLLVPQAGTYQVTIAHKNWTSACLTATVALGETVTTEQVTLYQGDFTGDGIIDVNDLSWLLNLIGLTNEDPQFCTSADVNGDQVINILDILTILPNVERGSAQP